MLYNKISFRVNIIDKPLKTYFQQKTAGHGKIRARPAAMRTNGQTLCPFLSIIYFCQSLLNVTKRAFQPETRTESVEYSSGCS